MNKSQLVESVATIAGVTKAEATRCFDAITQKVIEAVKSEGRMMWPGLGSFSISHRQARTGRNPQTGAPIQIKASRVVKFKAAKKLKDEVN